MSILNRALDYLKQAKKNYQTMSVLFNLGSVYLEQNRDTLRREISKEIIDQIELRYRSEILQARVNEMSITQKYDRSRLLLTYLVAVFIILVLGIITISIFVRRCSDNIKRLLVEERARFAEK